MTVETETDRERQSYGDTEMETETDRERQSYGDRDGDRGRDA